MTDLKLMEFAHNNSYWERTLADCSERGVSLPLIESLCYPQGRETLVEQVATGQYVLQPPTEGYLDKDTGNRIPYSQLSKHSNVRKIYSNKGLDKVVLSQLYRVYYGMYHHLIHPNCMSYRQGSAVSDTILKVSKQLPSKGYKADLSKFFDSVSRPVLFKLLEDISSNSVLDEMLFRYYSDDRVYINKQLSSKYKSLGQGCAISCLLADLVLRDIDEEMSNLGVIYYRYSDDILILGDKADKAFAHLGKCLADKSLSLNPKKVESISPDRWFPFLGAYLKGNSISFTPKRLKKYCGEIRTICLHNKGVKAVRKVLRYLYFPGGDRSKLFGIAPSLFSIVNNLHDLIEFDNYIKDCLKASVTGHTHLYGLGSVQHPDYAVTHGIGKSTGYNSQVNVEELGYISLLHMYKCYHTSPSLYQSQLQQLL